MIYSRLWKYLFLFCCLTACSLSAPLINRGGNEPQLLAPVRLERPVSVALSLIMESNQGRLRLPAQLEAGPQETVLVGFSVFGSRSFLVRSDGRRVHSELSAPGRLQFDPVQLLADLQLIFWPLSRVKQELPGVRVEADSFRRRVSRLNGGLELEITYSGMHGWSGETRLSRPESGYQLLVRSRESD